LKDGVRNDTKASAIRQIKPGEHAKLTFQACESRQKGEVEGLKRWKTQLQDIQVHTITKVDVCYAWERC
jgi:hypothetical protein